MKPNTLWYKDAIFYEVRVKSFSDSNGDGIGDLPGLTSKLDYLQDLGVTTLWLLPFYPSPMRDDGYDISDYMSVDPDHGTLQDFKNFLREAHERGLRVVTELVLNHTSDKHPWFERARQDKPGGRWRNYYVWSDTNTKFAQTRIIFKDFETSNWAWDPVANAHYWHRFYSHQPDLNYDNPEVRKTMLQVVDFWLQMGVDGLRLDAVPYLFEREGTSCENLPETHAFLKEVRKHIDKKFSDRMLLAEANQWPEDAAFYFGQGDETNVAFHFPLMPRMFMALHMEDRFPIVDILNQTPSIPDNCQWATFLRNHDELTLEMVSEEERDYMYRFYASDPKARINLGIRRRLAPLLGNDRKKIELMNGLLLSLPGTPVLYYGDEIGLGDNIFLGDRNGVRTPMQWSADRNAGFSRANPQQLLLPVIVDPEYHYETINVEAQQNNPHSLLWWMKRLIAQRKQNKALSQGTIEFLSPNNARVLSFLRQHGDMTVLVVANLSRFTQFVELDLSKHKGKVPIELFGRTEFPRIGDLPYFVTLGPHAFYWFALEPAKEQAPLAAMADAPLPEISVKGEWNHVFKNASRAQLESILSLLLKSRPWFNGQKKLIKQSRITETIPFTQTSMFVFLQVDYVEGGSETYGIPMSFHTDKDPAASAIAAGSGIARLKLLDGKEEVLGTLYDAFYDVSMAKELLDTFTERKKFRGNLGVMSAQKTTMMTPLLVSKETPTNENVTMEPNNTSLVFGDRLILKLFRYIQPGINPDVEVSRYLSEKTSFKQIPRVAGTLDYTPAKGEKVTLAMLEEFIPNQGSAWELTLNAVQRFYELALAHPLTDVPLLAKPWLAMSQENPSALAQELVGPHLTAAALLGERTAQMHIALGSPTSDAAFKPESFSSHDQWALYQSMRSAGMKTMTILKEHLSSLPENTKADAQRVLDNESKILKMFRALVDMKLSAIRIRCHGNFHLEQVLYTGKDFVMIDFEGNPSRPLTERRIKRSPLHDVAGMMRSFHYAAGTALTRQTAGPVARTEDKRAIAPWAIFWQQWVSSAFLKGYLAAIQSTKQLPSTPDSLHVMLTAFIMEKALSELRYELVQRPEWSRIPIQGILQMLDA